MNQNDYIDAGFKIFGLHGADNGVCTCGDPACKALYKHPRISNWQSVPQWSDEQLETFEMMGHFDTGFGVLCSGYLIVDVDARNGGVESFERLPDLAPGFVVATGSGGGSKHLYFSLHPGVAISQHHKDYPGIDFKSSGFVVGAGSLHASGNFYEATHGHPDDITPAPQWLIDLLRKPEYIRTSVAGSQVDVTEGYIVELLNFISPDCDYDKWIRVGMAIHHVFMGDGIELWDGWSSNGSDYAGRDLIDKHWHSFGKSQQPAGLGTIIHYARAGGYTDPVTFEYSEPEAQVELSEDGIDILRPPGFVGELCQWINDQCRYPAESLAVASALAAVGSIAGMRYCDAMDDITPNLIAFCVAGAGVGKEAVQQAYLKIMREAGVAGAVHGAFKSEQELMRNFVRHQAAYYMVDELGLTLRKLVNSAKGGASYLEGIIGLIMSVYSKANGYLPVTGDLKESIRDDLIKEASKLNSQREKVEAGSQQESRIDAEMARVEKALKNIEVGLENPFLSIVGYTTPVTFDSLMDFEQATNGFLARAIIFKELETNPARKPGFSKRPMPDSLKYQLSALYAPGVFDLSCTRVEFTGKKTSIPTTADGSALMDLVYDEFHSLAEDQKGTTGLEAIPRRGYEIAAKLSLILAIPEGVRTAEHIRWAYAVAKRDCMNKIKLAYSTDAQANPLTESSGHAAKILSLITKEHGETLGVIANRLRKLSKPSLITIIDDLERQGKIRRVKEIHKYSKNEVDRFFAV